MVLVHVWAVWECRLDADDGLALQRWHGWRDCEYQSGSVDDAGNFACMSIHVQPTHLHSKNSTPVALDLQTAMMAISRVMTPHQPRSQANTFIFMRKQHRVLNPSIPRDAHTHHHY